ncbi:DEHA2A07040p [Debaryomyces hansenii CBS767]|uniref:ethanolamine-phosphate cytidylyltransferase n=1 Tax=Debaryomyces hansenii (strain ATCC 36239 / CBS 767 / BCRC 21394 / JCM 1990 / NBRC 0083 / IGC 2968) TaxID=284592 RepID=Q6BYT8_DEBHA|nr:DEHA2A07040p [Debaryomyces hansenii CBS767]CAG84587.2 DEHA2A07040p [Debaryomyces hansenii CBS767]|eukprot:XP_456631.2 DEHA2A07040p [Debaryomyces hansenii CBS767]
MFERPEGIENCRIWMDGCFDFVHHGHAGAMLQARQLGKELYVGIHSDEDILKNKGPVVMTLKERVKAVEACKWSTQPVPDAPYVTDPKVMDGYGCKYVVHGDDITTDANGEDCYQEVKDLGKFVVVKRTPNISTTDLVGRMLLMSKDHHFQPIRDIDNHSLLDKKDNLDKFAKYATDETGLKPGSGVYLNIDTDKELHTLVEPSKEILNKYKSIAYVDGGFDLFHPGHIEALRLVKQNALKDGCAIIVGVHDDHTINNVKGLNYPIMNIFERALCILQCAYVDGIVLGAPFSPTSQFLSKLPGTVAAVYHGPTQVEEEPYAEAKQNGLFKEIGPHEFANINTEFIVHRVLNNKEAYEARQKAKGWKADHEAQLRVQEQSRHKSS